MNTFLKNETLNKTREVQKANIFEIHKDRSEFQNLNHAYVPEKPNKITSQSMSQFLEILVKKKQKQGNLSLNNSLVMVRRITE